MIHHIQRAILDSLATAEAKRYGELKPAELDGNVFGYHLKRLMTDKMIDKLEDGSYRLSESGRKHIITRFENPLESAHSIFLLLIKHVDGRYLMRQRTIQPMLGYTGFVHGEPHPRETVVKTAQHRLFDKTGIDCELSVVSSGTVAISKDNEMQSYTHAIVLTGTTAMDISTSKDATGVNFWLSREELEESMVIPSTVDILKSIEAQHTWFELSYNL